MLWEPCIFAALLEVCIFYESQLSKSLRSTSTSHVVTQLSVDYNALMLFLGPCYGTWLYIIWEFQIYSSNGGSFVLRFYAYQWAAKLISLDYFLHTHHGVSLTFKFITSDIMFYSKRVVVDVFMNYTLNVHFSFTWNKNELITNLIHAVMSWLEILHVFCSFVKSFNYVSLTVVSVF